MGNEKTTASKALLDMLGPLVRIDKDSARAWVDDEADGVVFVWSANTLEQIDEFLLRFLLEFTSLAEANNAAAMAKIEQQGKTIQNLFKRIRELVEHQTPRLIAEADPEHGECFVVWDGMGWAVAAWLEDEQAWGVEHRRIKPTYYLPLPQPPKETT